VLRTKAADVAERLGVSSWYLSGSHRSGDEAEMPGWTRFGSKFGHKTRLWRSVGPQSLLANHFSRVRHPELLVRNMQPSPSLMNDENEWVTGLDALAAMRQVDYSGYMLGDILVKVDRATMAVGLEARCPILDVRISRFAWTLPNGFLLNEAGGKRILKSLLERYVPKACIDRPKRGFGVPVAEWLRGPLREWAEDLLSSGQLAHDCFYSSRIRTLWEQHICGWRDNSKVLWSVLMFQAWMGR